MNDGAQEAPQPSTESRRNYSSLDFTMARLFWRMTWEGGGESDENSANCWPLTEGCEE